MAGSSEKPKIGLGIDLEALTKLVGDSQLEQLNAPLEKKAA